MIPMLEQTLNKPAGSAGSWAGASDVFEASPGKWGLK